MTDVTAKIPDHVQDAQKSFAEAQFEVILVYTFFFISTPFFSAQPEVAYRETVFVLRCVLNKLKNISI